MILMSTVRLIRELIVGSPILLMFTLALGIVFALILFQVCNKYEKVGDFIERGLILVFIFTVPVLTLVPFNYLNFNALADPNPNAPALNKLPLFVYSFISFILLTKVRYFIYHDLANLLTILLKQNPCFFLYIILPVISTTWSDTPEVTFMAGFCFFILSIFGIYISAKYPWKDLSFFLRWSHLLIGLVSFVKTPPGVGQWAGITLSKNKLGSLLALSTAFWYLKYIQPNKTNPDHRLKALLITFFSFYLTRTNKSGGAFVTVVMLVSLVSVLSYLKKLRFQLAFAAIIMFLVVGINLSLIIAENLEGIFNFLEKDMTLTGRTLFWPIIVRLILRRPLLGYGYYGFWQKSWRGKESPSYEVFFNPGEPFWPPNAHNGYLEILLEGGIVGFILFVISFFRNLELAVRYLMRADIGYAGYPLLFLTLITINNITESTLTSLGNVWFYYVITSVRLALDTKDSLNRS